MQPQEFAAKWRVRAHEVTEEQAYQEHYADVASLVGGHAPGQPGAPTGLTYQAGVHKIGSSDFGKADVFLPGHFIWEAKRAQTNSARAKALGAALQQASLYAYDLGNPPLIVVTDFIEIRVHTTFTGTIPRMYRLTLDDIGTNAKLEGTQLTALDVLRAVFHSPSDLDPRLIREQMTEEATGQIGSVARAMVERGHERGAVAHFMMRVVFAMFAEDVRLLEHSLLTDVLKRCETNPDKSQGYFAELFSAMSTGGEFWGKDVKHFNGGLFDDGFSLPITSEDAAALLVAARLDWGQVEPAIFGGLFENSLEAEVRGKRGAHFTGVNDIARIVEPVIVQDLTRRWEAARAEARGQYETAEAQAVAEEAKGRPRVAADLRTKGRREAADRLRAFQQELLAVRVLDAACGSGNFLYVALKRLLDLEQVVLAEAAEYGVGKFDLPPQVHPRQMLGIEVEGFAAELASVTLWIGFIQWNHAHGGYHAVPVLERLGNIEHRNALFNPDGTEAQWPEAEYIVGNPPFLGGKMLRKQLGDVDVNHLFVIYDQRVARESDLVCYWFEKARQALKDGRAQRAGLVTTNSIRGGANRQVLERIQASGGIFAAWGDEPWVQNGAAVRVSFVCFDDGQQREYTLNGLPVAHINPDLTAATNVTTALPLTENRGVSFMGTTKGGPFEISDAVAQQWLKLPNPNGQNNADVIRKWVNGMDLTRRPRGEWVIDFGLMSQEEASGYLTPFEHVHEHVLPERAVNKRESYQRLWWLHAEPRPAMRQAFRGLSRYIGTSIVSKHRIFVWLDIDVLPSNAVIAVAREDDFHFGVLQSRVHESWALVMGTALEDRPRYTASTCFETFPFPRPTDPQRTEIEKWAKYVVQLRDHLLAQDGKATLTGIYNMVVGLREKPNSAHPVSALVTAHAHLDYAVAAAYGWEWPLTKDEVLARLLALNLERATSSV